ncbi:LOW QUALITY PROTEIN: small ribosomal subunit protein eS4-like [Lampetra planeri]
MIIAADCATEISFLVPLAPGQHAGLARPLALLLFQLLYRIKPSEEQACCQKSERAVRRVSVLSCERLCKACNEQVTRFRVGTKGVPFLVRYDAHTIRYPDPLIKVNDTAQLDLEDGKITDFIKFDAGNLCMVTGGANLGRIGVFAKRERHLGSFDVAHVKDANAFATRPGNIFVVGKGQKPWVSLPRGKGVRLTIAEERD